MKTCKRCKRDLPLDSFALYNLKSQPEPYRYPRCNECRRRDKRDSYERMKEDPERWEHYQQMRAAQYQRRKSTVAGRRKLRRQRRDANRQRIAKLRADPERWQQYVQYNREHQRRHRERLAQDPAAYRAYHDKRNQKIAARRQWLKKHRPTQYQDLLERHRLAHWDWLKRNDLPLPKYRRTGFELKEKEHDYDIAPFREWLERKLEEYGEHTLLAEVLGVDPRLLYSWRHQQPGIRLATVDRCLTNEGSSALAELYDDNAKPLCESAAHHHPEHDRPGEQTQEDEVQRLEHVAA